MQVRFLFSVVLLSTLIFSVSAESKAAKKNIVFWLSIDGFRGDYLDHSQTPEFDALLSRSLYSRKLLPIFPSITFPSHVSQATGVQVQDHGISSNSFYDSLTSEILSYPNDSSFLQAEPIWQTAKRQGLKTAVSDWPLSYNQKGPASADYFHMAYEVELTDEERIERTLKAWEKGPSGKGNYDLVMSYIVGTDSVGHSYGPRDGRVFREVERVDKLVGVIHRKIKEIAEKKYPDNYNLYFMITTDHGMIDVNEGVNIRILSELLETPEVRTITSGNVGHVFLDKVPTLAKRKEVIAKLSKIYKKYPFIKFYEKKNLPKRWEFAHKTRVGDLVVILDSGYIFTGGATRAVMPISEIGGPYGMHGYDPKSEKGMKGLFMLYRYPEFSRGVELKSAPHSLELHPSVSHLLGVKPAAGAKGRVIPEFKNLK
jgi:predicted AlkP superfamily pyrophosphatase or phosphodiesterase